MAKRKNDGDIQDGSRVIRLANAGGPMAPGGLSAMISAMQKYNYNPTAPTTPFGGSPAVRTYQSNGIVTVDAPAEFNITEEGLAAATKRDRGDLLYAHNFFRNEKPYPSYFDMPDPEISLHEDMEVNMQSFSPAQLSSLMMTTAAYLLGKSTGAPLGEYSANAITTNMAIFIRGIGFQGVVVHDDGIRRSLSPYGYHTIPDEFATTELLGTFGLALVRLTGIPAATRDVLGAVQGTTRDKLFNMETDNGRLLQADDKFVAVYMSAKEYARYKWYNPKATMCNFIRVGTKITAPINSPVLHDIKLGSTTQVFYRSTNKTYDRTPKSVADIAARNNNRCSVTLAPEK
jgi:hypothetical protein